MLTPQLPWHHAPMRGAGRGLRTVVLSAAFATTCSHAHRPCPPQRPAPASTPLAPADAATTAAIAEIGASYQSCPDEPVYLITRDGQRELSEPELKALQEMLRTQLPGIESTGLGGAGCRPPATRGLGVQLGTRAAMPPPEAIARQLIAALRPLEGDPTARLQITVHTVPSPRCAPTDPTCGPLPYEAACIERTDYDPKAPRKLVRSQGRTRECAHDGECFVAGCGNDCVPANLSHRAGTCQGYAHWENVYCGCVDTACAWFTNP